MTCGKNQRVRLLHGLEDWCKVDPDDLQAGQGLGFRVGGSATPALLFHTPYPQRTYIFKAFGPKDPII